MTSATAGTAAERQGRLWGARPAEWAEHEEMEPGRFAAALDGVAIPPGAPVLEVGCGSGVLLELLAARGHRVTGLDAAVPLAELARARVPGADVRVGDLEALPFADDSFAAVIGLNVFFFAADMVRALREAGRVAYPGAPILIGVWGRPERCEILPLLGAVRALDGPPAGPPPASLATPGVLEGIAAAAGLGPERAFAVDQTLVYPDTATAVRRLAAAGGMVEIAERHGEGAVADALRAAVAPFRGADGSVRLTNEWHHLVARAP